MTDLDATYDSKAGTIAVHFWSNLTGPTGIMTTHRLTVAEAEALMREISKALAKVPVAVSAADLGLEAA